MLHEERNRYLSGALLDIELLSAQVPPTYIVLRGIKCVWKEVCVWEELLPFCVGAGIDTAVSLHASGSLSNPLSLLVMVLNAPLAVVPLLSEPKLFKLRPSLDERPGVGEVGGESQLMSRSGAVTEEVKGSWDCFLVSWRIPVKVIALWTALSCEMALGGGGRGGAIFFLGSEEGLRGALQINK